MTYELRRIPERKYHSEFTGIVRRAELSKDTMHDLRRAAITAWAESKELQPHEVMKLAGHSSLETTLKYYVHVKRSIVQRAKAAGEVYGAGDSIAKLLQRVI